MTSSSEAKNKFLEVTGCASVAASHRQQSLRKPEMKRLQDMSAILQQLLDLKKTEQEASLRCQGTTKALQMAVQVPTFVSCSCATRCSRCLFGASAASLRSATRCSN
jgi:hypothetical protein